MRPIASRRGVLTNWGGLVALFVVFSLGWMASVHAQGGVCAGVKIEIKQKLSLDRRAFDAVMRVNNGLHKDATRNGANLTFQDQAGNGLVAISDPNNINASFFARINLLEIADRHVEGR